MIGLFLRSVMLAGLLCCGRAVEHPLAFSTFFGGNFLDSFNAVATDEQGNVYCAGWSWSSDFPVKNAYKAELDGDSDCVLAKFNANGELIFATYFGGGSEDGVETIFVEPSGEIWIAGFAHSADLETTEGAFQMDYGGGSAFADGDGFIAKFSSDGSQVLYCTYVGGSGDDIVTDLEIGPEGEIVIAGTTDSPGFFGAKIFGKRGKQDGYIARLDRTGGELLDAALIAGEDEEEAVNLELGEAGKVFFGGATYSTNFFTTEGAQDRENNPAWASRDGFFGVYDPKTATMEYLSLFGSGSDEGIFDLALRSDGAVVVTGINGTFLTETNGVFQPEPGYGPNDAFVGVLQPPEWGFEWVSYLGGSGSESGRKIGLDSEGNIFIIGETDSDDFVVRDPLRTYGGGETDPFVVKISRDGTTLLYGTYLGGSSNDRAWSMAVGPDDSVTMVGWAASDDFPLRNAFMEEAPFLDTHAFVTRIRPGPAPPIADPPPNLAVALSGNKVVVSWPEVAEEVVLESSGVARTLHWKVVEGNAVTVGGRKAMILDRSEKMMFFRLRRVEVQ